jgi:hypothetical protein
MLGLFLQIPLLLISVAMILHGLFGPSLAPKNLATTLSWLHFRGILVLVLLCTGNFFCLACPFHAGASGGAALLSAQVHLAAGHCETNGFRSRCSS